MGLRNSFLRRRPSRITHAMRRRQRATTEGSRRALRSAPLFEGDVWSDGIGIQGANEPMTKVPISHFRDMLAGNVHE